MGRAVKAVRAERHTTTDGNEHDDDDDGYAARLNDARAAGCCTSARVTVAAFREVAGMV